MTMWTQKINRLIKNFEVTDEISDWFHTFWELYKHRIHLFLALCKYIQHFQRWISEHAWVSIKKVETLPNSVKIIKSKLHHDWSWMDWWFIVQLETWAWQISYHLPNEYWDKCKFAITLEKANEWDWHTSDDVLERLLKL